MLKYLTLPFLLDTQPHITGFQVFHTTRHGESHTKRKGGATHVRSY